MIASSRRKGVDLAAAFGACRAGPEQRFGEPFGRAIALQELRNDVLADDQVGEDDGFDLRVQGA